MYLTDLTFLEDGSTDKLERDLINFAKRRKLSFIIRDIKQYQQTAYSGPSFDIVPEIRSYLLDMQWVDENKLWDMSLLCEPRDANPT